MDLTRNLLRIAIYNISYIRGLFPEKHFSDKSVPALEMKIKKLMPMDAESRRLIDWMEKGVYDALQKKYLKTLLFCICEEEEGPMIEEYAFSFSYPNTSTEEVAMNLSRSGSKKGSTTFTSNASEVTPDQMRISACKMIRTLVSLMRTLDPMPEERTIIMKLLYYDDTPEDYEPPFFKCCAGNEAINIWNKNPLKMEVGNVNSKHLVLALKVKSVLDPCDDNNVNSADDGMSVDNESDHDDDFSDTEVRPSEAERYIVAPNDRKCKGQNTGTISEDDTQDAAHEEELTIQVKEWICSREIGTVNVPDVLSNFPDISMEMIEDIMERLLKDGVLSRASKDGYTINQTIDPKTLHIKEVIVQNVSPTEGTKQNNGDLIYMKALYHALPMDYVTIPKLQGKLDGEANHNMVQKLIGKMVQDGYVKNSANRRLGKAVIHSESNNRKFLEIKKILEGNEGEQMAIDTNAEHTECERKDLLKANEMRDCFTMGCLHSIGSDLTRTRELPELQQNVSMQSGQEAKDEELYHALPRDYMATAKLQGKMNGNLWSELKRSLRKMNKGHTLSKILGSLVGRRIFSTTSDNEGDTFKNFAVICLDGDAFKVLSSFVNAIVYYRFWNFSRGKSVDASPILDNNMKLYTVSPDGTFHFIVVYRNDILDFVFDGIQAWFKGVIKEGNSFQFKSETDCNAYINPRLCGELSFDGKYHNIAPDTFPGKIPLGFEAIIDAFNEIKVFDGEETDKFRFALGTWVIFLGEAPKFHRVFLACCKSLVLEDISSLDSFDESLGLMVKKWGKLCDILMKHLIRALSGHSIPCLDEILEEITVRQVPKITTLRHILDNICLFNHNSARDRGSHPETSETKSSSETKSPPTSKNPVCCPIDFSSNQYAERIRKYCQGQLYGDTDEEVAKPNMKVNLSLGDHAFANDAVTAFVERRKAVIFSPSTWRSELPFKHHGISVPKETLIKNTTANAPVAKRNLLMNMSRSQTFSTFVKALKKFKL